VLRGDTGDPWQGLHVVLSLRRILLAKLPMRAADTDVCFHRHSLKSARDTNRNCNTRQLLAVHAVATDDAPPLRGNVTNELLSVYPSRPAAGITAVLCWSHNSGTGDKQLNIFEYAIRFNIMMPCILMSVPFRFSS
jgi:hypothetical protein